MKTWCPRCGDVHREGECGVPVADRGVVMGVGLDGVPRPVARKAGKPFVVPVRTESPFVLAPSTPRPGPGPFYEMFMDAGDGQSRSALTLMDGDRNPSAIALEMRSLAGLDAPGKDIPPDQPLAGRAMRMIEDREHELAKKRGDVKKLLGHLMDALEVKEFIRRVEIDVVALGYSPPVVSDGWDLSVTFPHQRHWLRIRYEDGSITHKCESERLKAAPAVHEDEERGERMKDLLS